MLFFRLRLWWLRLPERLALWVAWQLPRSLVYFAAIRLWAHATSQRWGREHPSDIGLSSALDRWVLCGRCGTPRHAGDCCEQLDATWRRTWECPQCEASGEGRLPEEHPHVGAREFVEGFGLRREEFSLASPNWPHGEA